MSSAATASMKTESSKRTAPEQPSAPTFRKLDPIGPEYCTRNSAGFAWSEHMLRLPAGMILQDLYDRPLLLSRIQSNANTSLCPLDIVHIVDFEQSMVAVARVTSANATQASLSKPTITQLGGASSALFETGEFKVVWNGTSYCVQRKVDGHDMGSGFATPGAAEKHLFTCYPKRLHRDSAGAPA